MPGPDVGGETNTGASLKAGFMLLMEIVIVRETHLINAFHSGSARPGHRSDTGWSASGISTTSPHCSHTSREQSPELKTSATFTGMFFQLLPSADGRWMTTALKSGKR